MINFRFHLISLVAVFLALGVGVAMGASFVDRATVDSLRGRVDALEDSYRRRGAELDASRSQLSSADNQAAALAGEGSRALADRLPGVPVVVISTQSADGDVLDATRASLRSSGARIAASVGIDQGLGLPGKAELDTARQRFGLKGDAASIRARIASDLGVSLGLLAATPPGATSAPTTTTSPASAGTTTVLTTPSDAAGARAYIQALVDLGWMDVRDGDAPAGAGFPSGSDYRYVIALSAGESTRSTIEPLVSGLGRTTSAAAVVAEAGDTRSAGEVTTTTQGQPPRGATVAPMRHGDLASQVSTVDDLDEPFGRIAVVYAVAEQRELGRVGHYGTGAGAAAPFATVPTR